MYISIEEAERLLVIDTYREEEDRGTNNAINNNNNSTIITNTNNNYDHNTDDVAKINTNANANESKGTTPMDGAEETLIHNAAPSPTTGTDEEHGTNVAFYKIHMYVGFI